jgi:hypothetical protein
VDNCLFYLREAVRHGLFDLQRDCISLAAQGGCCSRATAPPAAAAARPPSPSLTPPPTTTPTRRRLQHPLRSRLCRPAPLRRPGAAAPQRARRELPPPCTPRTPCCRQHGGTPIPATALPTAAAGRWRRGIRAAPSPTHLPDRCVRPAPPPGAPCPSSSTDPPPPPPPGPSRRCWCTARSRCWTWSRATWARQRWSRPRCTTSAARWAA